MHIILYFNVQFRDLHRHWNGNEDKYQQGLSSSEMLRFMLLSFYKEYLEYIHSNNID